MSSAAPCFAAPLAVGPPRSGKLARRRAPVCVLDKAHTVRAARAPLRAPPTPAPAEVRRPRSGSSKYYTVLGEDVPEGDRPERPPFPWFEIIRDFWQGISSPALRAEKYGPIYRSSVMLQPTYTVAHLAAIEDMQRDTDVFRSRDGLFVLAELLGKDTIILLDGLDHAALRSVVAPAFAPALFPFYLDGIRDRVAKTLSAVERDVARNGTAKMDPVFTQHYLAIIIGMTTGMDLDSDVAAFCQKRFLSLFTAMFSPPFGPIWNNGLKARKEIVKIVEDLVYRNLIEKKDTIEKLREYGDKLSYHGSKDIKTGEVNVLLIAIANSELKTGAGAVNDPEVVKSLTNLILFLWFAGYATSAATTSCSFFEMGMDPAIWGQLKAEQEEIVRDAGSRTVEYEQVVSKMPLLDSFITEMLRMHPPGWGIFRVANKDVNILGKYVKAEEVLFLDFRGSMRNPKVYPNPDTIRIDRFMKRKGETPPSKIISFGGQGSPHYCIGASLGKVLVKTTLATLLRDFHVRLDPKQSREYSLIPIETPQSKIVVKELKKMTS